MFRFLERNKTVLLYLVVWIVVAAVHMTIIKAAYHFPFRFAFTDSLVFNTLFALFGVGLWYVARYSDLQKKAVLEIIIHHLTGTTITLIIWLSGGLFILQQLIINTEYLEFLSSTITVRIISGVFYYSIIMSVFYLIINIRDLKERIEKEARMNEMLREAELKTLRSQIRPHFLFNSLNSISSLTLSNAPKAQEMVIKLSEFMRYSLTQTDEQLIPLSNELYHVRLYLDIEKVRFGEKLQIVVVADDLCNSLKVPAMILQPLVENAIKYGVYESTEVNTIHLTCSCNEQALHITIQNDYDPEHQYKKGTGTGLQNVSKRLSAIYNRSDLMTIRKTQNQFIAELNIPLYGNN
ncbi:sensor histidine kinase [Bacteroidota bacterium]